jgi:hypothetical protein
MALSMVLAAALVCADAGGLKRLGRVSTG